MGIFSSRSKGFSKHDEVLAMQLAHIESSLKNGDIRSYFGAEERRVLKMACEMDKSPLAYMNLGVLVLYGVGGPQDIDEAERLFKQSAGQGNYLAYRYLALIEEESKYNLAKAAVLLQKGADSGDSRAMIDLGLMYMNGHGMPENRPEAIRLWKKAAALGEQEAIHNLRIAGA